MNFSGLGMHLGNLSRLSNALTRSISPENFTGEKGKGGMSIDGPAARQARDLGQGWKVSPYVQIEPGTTFTLADIERRLQTNNLTLEGRVALGTMPQTRIGNKKVKVQNGKAVRGVDGKVEVEP